MQLCTQVIHKVKKEPSPPAAGDPRSPYVCAGCLPRTLASQARSQAAFKAVATKRRRYKAWPSRRNDHK